MLESVQYCFMASRWKRAPDQQCVQGSDLSTEELQPDPERSISNHFWSQEVLPIHIWKKIHTGYRSQTRNCDVWTWESNTITGSKSSNSKGLMLSQFDYNIEYRRTANHGNADALSRLPASEDSTFDEEESEDDVQMVCTIEELHGQIAPADQKTLP